MPTKKTLLKRAEDQGLDVSTSMTKDEIETKLASQPAGMQPTAGVEGRSIDTDSDDIPNATQEDEGTFEKVYVVRGDEFDENDEERMGDFERNVRQQAQQVGLRTTGDVTLDSQEDQGDGESIRLTFTVPVIRAAAPQYEAEEDSINAVITNDEVGNKTEVKNVPNAEGDES